MYSTNTNYQYQLYYEVVTDLCFSELSIATFFCIVCYQLNFTGWNKNWTNNCLRISNITILTKYYEITCVDGENTTAKASWLLKSQYHVIKMCYSRQIPSRFFMISDKLTKHSGKSTCQIIMKVFQESFDLQIFVDLSVEKWRCCNVHSTDCSWILFVNMN